MIPKHNCIQLQDGFLGGDAAPLFFSSDPQQKKGEITPYTHFFLLGFVTFSLFNET